MGSAGSFGFIGAPGDHHNDYSHHQERANAITDLKKINRWHVARFAEFLQKMDSIKDVDGNSLLHHSIITFGSDMRDGNLHDDRNMPFLVAGRAGGRYKPGRVIGEANQYVELANIWLTIMQTMGLKDTEFGEGSGQSTGTLDL